MKAYYRLFAPAALFVLLTAASGSAEALITSTTTLSIGPSPGTAGSPITLIATIRPTTPSVPTGTVQFSEASSPTQIYTSPVVNGVATLILEPPAGSYTYTAAYQGDGTFTPSSGSSGEVVTSATNITLAVNPNPALFGQSATLTATVSPNSATGTVTFYEHSAVVGVAPVVGGVATYSTTLLPAGLRTLYARYSGDNTGDAPSTSGNITEGILAKPGLGFSPPHTNVTGNGPLIEVAGDFNLDGKTDLAVLNASDATIKIFLGNSDGTFTAGNTLTTGAGPVALATGDFNGDGILDLAVAAGDGVEVLYGASAGAFSSYVTTSVGTGGASSIAVADFNKDGLPDIAAINGTNLLILVSTGAAFNTGLFTTASIGSSAAVAMGVGDFNADGLADVVVITSAGASVLLNNSNLTAFTPTYSFSTGVNYVAGNGPNGVLIKDVNGDSNQDLLVTNGTDGTVSVLLGDGTGLFNSHGAFPAGPHPTSIAVSDFNGDGKSDLIVTNLTTYNATSNISVLLGNGDGTYHQPLGYAAEAGPASIVVADFNNDAKPDVAVLSSATNDLDILLNGFATLTVTQGNTQSAAVNNTFALPLQVTATAFGAPAANVVVTFTAPGSGASGFFSGSGASAVAVSNASGVATAPAYTANGIVGSDSVVASAGGNTVAFALMNNAQVCTFQVIPTGSILLDAKGGNVTFTVTASASNCMWNAASSSPSVLFGSTTGTGNGAVNVLFPANNTGADLAETVLIAGQSISVTVLATAQIFNDVPQTAYYFDAVNLLAAKGITSGCSTNPPNYCPTTAVTRAQMAVFIVRSVYGGDNFTLKSSTPYFNDVPATAFGFMWIQKMFELGITSGCGNGNYCPNDSVTRAQMAVFIIKARYGSTEGFDIPSTPYFTDVPLGAFGYNWIQRFRFDNITAGCGSSLFCPNNFVLRGDMAIFIMKGMFNALFPAGTPEILSVTPASVPVGSATTVTVTGTSTHFDANTVLNPIPNVTIGTITVISQTSLSVVLTPASGADTTQPYSVFITTSDQNEEVVLPNGLTLTP